MTMPRPIVIELALGMIAYGTISFAQVATDVHQEQAYVAPFCSSGNILELDVENGRPTRLMNVVVSGKSVPPWIKISPSEQVFEEISPGSSRKAVFNFDIDKSAPVGSVQTIAIWISAESGEAWSKEITLSVSAPDQFVLYQNFPNPFNPRTIISYTLPSPAHILLCVYNVLGQKIATMVDDYREAGYHEEAWNALGISSGLYLYQISYVDHQGNLSRLQKTLMVLK